MIKIKRKWERFCGADRKVYFFFSYLIIEYIVHKKQRWKWKIYWFDLSCEYVCCFSHKQVKANEREEKLLVPIPRRFLSRAHVYGTRNGIWETWEEPTADFTFPWDFLTFFLYTGLEQFVESDDRPDWLTCWLLWIKIIFKTNHLLASLKKSLSINYHTKAYLIE